MTRRHVAPDAKDGALARYRAMRDFTATPEPSGGEARGAAQAPSFTVQRHAARRLHYDFRLELDGVLRSWAVPKGPSLDPGEKRLAVQTEDHPLDYGDFEGVIPPKHYGAGEVVLWDRGHWTTEEADPAAALAKGKLKFRLDGEKLQGGWTLVRMRGGSRDDGGDGDGREGAANWLLIKENDDAARLGAEAEITLARPGSVKQAPPRTSAIKGRRVPAADRAGDGAAAVKGAPDEALPASLSPQLASLAADVPAGEGWVYEIKYDGYRLLARLASGTAALFTRNGHDWTARMPRLAKALAALGLDGSWLDGEIVVNGDDGLPDFQALQNAFDAGRTANIVFYVFDAPWLRGRDLRKLPLAERKRQLADAIAGGADGGIAFSEHFAGDPAAALEQACRLGLEGLIGKRADAAYASGRGRSWIKLKCRPREEFVIGGFTEPGGTREGFGALLVGLYDAAGSLIYAGKVGTGFDQAALSRLRARLAALETDRSPFARAPRAAAPHWVRPELVAEVEYAGWTREGLLRQASFAGLREDKPARSVQGEARAAAEAASDDAGATESTAEAPSPRQKAAPAEGKAASAERPGPAARAPKSPAATGAGGTGGSVRVAGVVISHPERVVWPGRGLTKADLARYYEEVGEWMLPHIANRPLSLLRCPDGSAAECFFQRHMGQERPAGVESFVREGSAPSRRSYLYVTRLEGVVGMVQRGAIEFHTWGSTMPKPERPDRITIDLDPAPDVPWSRVVEAARLVQGLLGELGLGSFLKTTGGKGLHVVVPLRRGPAWEEVKRFSKAVAGHLARLLPDRFTANMAKDRRGGRIFIDYLRNDASATAVCAFSARARPDAPVSVPLAWDELGDAPDPATFTIVTVPRRLAGLDEDPWREYAARNYVLARAMWEALGEAPPASRASRPNQPTGPDV